MKQVKNKFLLALLVMIMVLSSTTAFAATPTPRWSYLASMWGVIDVNDYNYATISVTCSSDDPIDNMKAKTELQQLDGSWKTIKTWTESSKQSYVAYDKNYAIKKGYSYRLKITAYAYQGSSLKESATEYFDYGYYQ